MNAPIDPITADRRDLAAYWFARAQSGTMTDTERRQFTAWRDADPLNDQQYRRVQALWDAAGRIPASRLRELGYATGAAPSRILTRHTAREDISPSRRRFLYGAAAACATGAAVIGTRYWPDAPHYEATYATRHGQQRHERLPDGTQFNLNTGTSAVVRFYHDRRTVALSAGEILCNVVPETDRPFVVDADMGSARTLNACFNVRRDGDSLVIAVVKGEVEFSTGPWWRRHRERLGAGKEASTTADHQVALSTASDIAARTAWNDGQIVFRGTPLADAIAELNRYLPTPVLLRDPKVHHLRISGIFRIDDPGALLAALPRILPVQVRPLENGRTEIVAI